MARKAQEAADAAALAVIEEAEQKVAAAQAEAAAATQRALDAEAVADALQGEALLAIKPAEFPAAVTSDYPVAAVYRSGQKLAHRAPAPAADAAAPVITEAEAMTANDYAELKLRRELGASLAGKTRPQVVDALIDGTLHHAIKIDWAAMGPIPPTP